MAKEFIIPREVVHKLGHYVYLYSHPVTRRPFYVGKGKGKRMLSHLGATGRAKKAEMIRSLKKRKLKPCIEILAHGLANADVAFRVECAAIDLFGLDGLTNLARGKHSGRLGRMSLRDIVTLYNPQEVKIHHPGILIRVNQLYSRSISARKLYEITRGVWRLSRRRVENVEYAFAVFDGIIRQVYRVKSWHKAGTTRYYTVSQSGRRRPHRLEFIGEEAPRKIREIYIDKSVERLFSRGSQNPVVYVGC